MKNSLIQVLILALALPSLTRAANPTPPPYYTAAVVDDQGRPVAGAMVDAYVYQPSEGWGYRDREPELAQRTVTGSNGVFSLLPSPGATLAVVKKPGLATAWKTWSSLLENSSDPVILTPSTPLAGIVLDESNHPVPGAEVWVTQAIIGNQYGREEQANELFGAPARESFSTKTGADGRFRIPNFPAAGHAGLAVKAAGKALRPSGEYAMTREHQSGDDDIQLRVAPAGAVEGKVTVEDTGQPLAGIKIKLEGSKSGLYGSEYRDTIESAEDGSFRIPDVQPGEYNVRAIFPGQPVPDWVLSTAKLQNGQVTVVAGETTRGLEIQASKGAIVQVSVVMTNDLSPVVGVPVSAAGSTAYTGINGMAMFRVPLGRNYFSTRKDSTSQSREADVEAGHITNVWIQLIPPPTITGTVRDPSGAPVPGALVSYHPGHSPNAPDAAEATTDKNGRYEIILKLSREDMEWDGPISETNCIVARDLGRNLAAIHDFVEIPAKLDLDLQPGITLSGSVKDTNGAPITNATVDLHFLLGNMVAPWASRPAKVNAQGSFSFPAMPQGRQYFIYQLTAKGYGSASTDIKATDTKTNHHEFPTFVLKRADRKLAGQILDLGGKPVSGATVRFNGQGQPQFGWQQLETKTDSQGHFAFDKVCEGVVNIYANWNNVRTNILAYGGDTNILIKLGVTNAFPAAPPLRGSPIH
jgi:protocatechuate 3,4-dioxygenase beta subunit